MTRPTPLNENYGFAAVSEIKVESFVFSENGGILLQVSPSAISYSTF